MSLKDRINKMKQQNGNGALFHDISPFCRKVLITTAIASSFLLGENKAFSQGKDAVEKEKIENMAQPETGYKNRNLSFAERKASLDRAVEKGDVYMLGGHAEGEYVSYNVEGYGRVAVGNFDKEKGYYYFVLLSDQIEDFTYPALTDKGVENMTDFESHNRVEDIYISKTPADVNSFKHKNVTVWGTGRDPVDNSQTQRWVSIENDDDGNFPIATTVFEGFGKETVARTTYVFDNHPEHDKYYACTYESCYDGQRLSVQNRDDAGHLMRSCQYKKGDATLEVINYSTSGKVNKKENVPFYCPTFNYYFPLKYEWQRNDVLDEVKQDWNENEKRKEQSQLAAKDVKQLKDNLTR